MSLCLSIDVWVCPLLAAVGHALWTCGYSLFASLVSLRLDTHLGAELLGLTVIPRLAF